MFSKTAVDTFWRYIEERERIRLRREAGEPWPWTGDAILRRYRFTNVRRLHDRTTQEFLRIYQAHAKAEPEVALFNSALFRCFGTSEFAAAVGWVAGGDTKHVARVAAARLAAGERVFTGAYIISNDGIRAPKERVVVGNLAALWQEAPRVVDAIESTRTWRAGYLQLAKCRGFGGSGFMAKEVLQDYLLWRRRPVKDAATWTPVGPGARRGLNRLLGRPLAWDQREEGFTAEVVALRGLVQPRWKRAFPKAGELTAHDVQFCLCEVDKYLRTKNGEGKPRATYKPPAVAA